MNKVVLFGGIITPYLPSKVIINSFNSILFIYFIFIQNGDGLCDFERKKQEIERISEKR